MNSLALPSFDYSPDDIDFMDIADSTKIKYRNTWKRAVASGINLTDPDEVLRYSHSLLSSEKLFFSAVMNVKIERFKSALINNIDLHNTDAEQVAKLQLAILKLDNLRESTPTKQGEKGSKTHTWLSAKQVEEITALPDLTTVRGLRDYIVLAVLLGAGLRREELENLTFDSLLQQPSKNGMRDVLAVTGKGDKRRTVPISSKLARHLRSWKEITGSGFVLRSINKGGTINGSLSAIGIHNIVRQYGAMIGLPELDSHDLRRSFARLGYDAGVPVEQISKLLGHASVKTTMLYLGIDIDLESTISDFIPLAGD